MEKEAEEKAIRKRRRWDASTAEGDAIGKAPSAPPVASSMLSSMGLKMGPDGVRVPQGQSVSATNKLAALAAADDEKDKQRAVAPAISNVAALKNSIQARLAEAGNALRFQRQGLADKAWAPLLLDKQGRQIDESGKLVVLQKEQTASLLVNRIYQAGPSTGKKGVEAIKKDAITHIDPRVEMPSVIRERRTLRFVKPGKYIARAQTMRMKQISREMRANQFETSEDGKIRRQMALEPIPNVEWWDELLLDTESYESGLKPGAITNLIHVPVLLDPVAEPHAPAPMQMMLTKKERKKIKRIKKQEKQKEEQDKIRLGLIQAPEPKMRLSNLMRVLGNEAISEPSAMEARVRKQMETRAEKHMEHNESRKLTTEEKREKRRKKLQEDTNVEVHVAVFRAGDMTDGRRKFKVDISAQQYNLTGATVVFDNCNVVTVEGGPKGIKKFKRLMIGRIKWMPDELGGEDEVPEPDSEGEGGGDAASKKVYKKCVLVWTGVTNKRAFKSFRADICRTEQEARAIFKDRMVPQYWDMCRNYQEPAHLQNETQSK